MMEERKYKVGEYSGGAEIKTKQPRQIQINNGDFPRIQVRDYKDSFHDEEGKQLEQSMTPTFYEEKLKDEALEQCQSQINEVAQQMACLQQELVVMEMKLSYYLSQISILRIAIITFVILLLYMIMMPLKKQSEHLHQQDYSYQEHAQPIIQILQNNATFNNDYQVLVQPIKDTINIIHSTITIEQELSIAKLSRVDEFKFKVYGISVPFPLLKGAPHSRNLTYYKINNMMGEVFNLNRTLVSEINDIVREDDPQRIKKNESELGSMKEQESLRKLGENILNKREVLDDLIDKILENPQFHHYVDKLLHYLEKQVEMCKESMIWEFKSYARTQYKNLLNNKPYYDQYQEDHFNPIQFRYMLDDILYGRCFGEFNMYAKQLHSLAISKKLQ